LAEALRWSTETAVDWVAIVGSAAGVAAPLAIATVLGDPPSGFAAALGSLMAGGTGAGRDRRAQVAELLVAVVPAVAATVASGFGAGRGWLTDALVVVLAGTAATVGGYSRAAAVATTRFIPFLIVAAAVAETAADRIGLVLLMLAGVLWTAVVSLVLGAAARASKRRDRDPHAVAAPQPTAAEKRARWRRSLAQLSGWQYPVRLTLCLAAATGLRWLWPEHHLHWIALTVALLSSRQIEILPIRTTQRALGTALGVLATGFLLPRHWPPVWAVVAGLGLLGGMWPLLRARNYLAYSAAMTPAIIVVMDGGRPLGVGVLIDRLVATLIGAGLVIGVDLIFSKAVAANRGTST
jgi:hypothetical protein